MESHKPFFSICIPNYNYANYVGETIESVLSQTYQDFEIIIVDNASTDNSWEVIQGYALKDTRIKAYRNNYNIGFAPNLQKASSYASGAFFIMLSSDDLMLSNALEIYHSILISKKEQMYNRVLTAATYQVNSSGDIFRTVSREANSFNVTFYDGAHENEIRIDSHDAIATIRYALKTNKGIGAFLSTCYPADLWRKVEGYDTRYHIFPDKAFLFKILLLKPYFLYTNQVLFKYRVHNLNQNAINNKTVALKHQIDGFFRVLNFSNNDLDIIGYTKQEVASFFIDNLCVKHIYICISEKRYREAFQILLFALAVFPTISSRKVLLVAALPLLLLGPIGSFIVKRFKKYV